MEGDVRLGLSPSLHPAQIHDACPVVPLGQKLGESWPLIIVSTFPEEAVERNTQWSRTLGTLPHVCPLPRGDRNSSLLGPSGLWASQWSGCPSSVGMQGVGLNLHMDLELLSMWHGLPASVSPGVSEANSPGTAGSSG